MMAAITIGPIFATLLLLLSKVCDDWKPSIRMVLLSKNGRGKITIPDSFSASWTAIVLQAKCGMRHVRLMEIVGTMTMLNCYAC